MIQGQTHRKSKKGQRALILEKIGANLQGDGTGNFMMLTGTSFSWFFFGIEWIDDHSGFFIALAAMISTLVTIWGAFKANGARSDKHE
jgi:hypothetical protein|tara:strand:+ start:119 stop:382 length:264 start_codon:yes stop_codon:yes gene_type:complete